MRTEIFIPFAFSPEIKPGKMGPIFEMRTYTHAPGEQGKVAKTWEKALPARVKISPLVAMWYAECGSVNRFVHIWSYPTLEARNEMRNKALAEGVWPPSLVAKKEGLPEVTLVAQENKIVMPSAFSPLQ